MTFEIYKLEWILSRHTFGNTTCYIDSYIKISTNPWDSNKSILFIKMILPDIKFTRNRAVDVPGVRPYVYR